MSQFNCSPAGSPTSCTFSRSRKWISAQSTSREAEIQIQLREILIQSHHNAPHQSLICSSFNLNIEKKSLKTSIPVCFMSSIFLQLLDDTFINSVLVFKVGSTGSFQACRNLNQSGLPGVFFGDCYACSSDCFCSSVGTLFSRILIVKDDPCCCLALEVAFAYVEGLRCDLSCRGRELVHRGCEVLL